MLKNIGHVKNPLTIIAIFSGIAEISGTVVLPFISDANQNTFMWFLMIFPFTLVILFFSTLNFNHKVLYAPSDYSDEENFMALLRSKDQFEKPAKLDPKKIASKSPNSVTISTGNINDFFTAPHGK